MGKDCGECDPCLFLDKVDNDSTTHCINCECDWCSND